MGQPIKLNFNIGRELAAFGSQKEIQQTGHQRLVVRHPAGATWQISVIVLTLFDVRRISIALHNRIVPVYAILLRMVSVRNSGKAILRLPGSVMIWLSRTCPWLPEREHIVNLTT